MSENLEEKLRQLKLDQESEWWKAKENDEFNLKTKLLRVGCRPLKRKYLACKKSSDVGDPDMFHQCKKKRVELDECYRALHFLHLSMAHEKVDRESINEVVKK